ncbi:hypothetical protein [Thalassotalea sp. Y01]|uniref:hypothetical protein n=1 Tax=Thalassotalea sp. Y01 TaxID=2729613 RepID=UPI00145F6251|nr:hypothetical protein [Thalassotalea sp. Y01]NMP15304.1 hypothetical protein [Thalassotalea sp. Y01]
MTKLYIILLFSGICTITGCSNKTWYQIGQQNRIQECRKLPYEQAIECEQDYKKSYKEYKEERKQIINSPPTKKE